jgi:hypothetical protein
MTAASRLDRMIARLTAQRACLRLAARLIADLPGPVIELGLGKARTYDHLVRLLPERAVFAFDRGIHCPPDAVPPADRLVLGEFEDTLPGARDRLGAAPVLVHVDMGTADRAGDAGPAARVGALLAGLVAPGGMVVADREMGLDAWDIVAVPQDAGDWPYFLWRNPVRR